MFAVRLFYSFVGWEAKRCLVKFLAFQVRAQLGGNYLVCFTQYLLTGL